jgi:predicted nucleotidyltransferase
MASRAFWKEWKHITKQELKAIDSLLQAKKLILRSIPPEELISIYVKGSFVRREMVKNSDVDLVIIVTHSRTLKKIIRLHNLFSSSFIVPVGFSGYSLWELRKNKRSLSGKLLRAAPNRFVAHLEHYQLIHGHVLKKELFFQVTHKKRLQGMIRVFLEEFIPKYDQGLFGFSDILKQVFWLVENEQQYENKSPPHHWKTLAGTLHKSHIIHQALSLRNNPSASAREQKIFIKRLTSYLEELRSQHT